jgi:hypothetical protein
MTQIIEICYLDPPWISLKVLGNSVHYFELGSDDLTRNQIVFCLLKIAALLIKLDQQKYLIHKGDKQIVISQLDCNRLDAFSNQFVFREVQTDLYTLLWVR